MNPELWRPETAMAFADAEALARQRGNQQPSEEHLLAALIAQDGSRVAAAIRRAGADPKAVSLEIERVLAGKPRDCDAKAFGSRELERAMAKAEESMRETKSEKVAAEHVLLGLLDSGNAAASLLARLGATPDKILLALTAAQAGSAWF